MIWCSSYLEIRIFLFHIFFINAPPTTQIYTLSTRRSSDLLSRKPRGLSGDDIDEARAEAIALEFLPEERRQGYRADRKSTRLNSSHVKNSYAVFCLKKKKIRHTSAIIQQHDPRLAFVKKKD